METQKTQIEAITQVLSGEFFKALGFSSDGRIANTFSPWVRKAVQRFSEIMAGFDQQVEAHGLQAASQWILPNFIRGMQLKGAECIPKEGPLLITGNHPGAYDALVLTSNLPRDDLRIIASIPKGFVDQLPAAKKHVIHITSDPVIRVQVVRTAIRHLKEGGALMIFAGGGISPDPEFVPGAEDEIRLWSRSLETFIRRVPHTQVLLTIISGILSPQFINHPFTVFRKELRDKLRITEFMQVMNQMLSPGKVLQNPSISFRNFKTAGGIAQTSEPLAEIVRQSIQLLRDHMVTKTSSPA